MTTSVDDATQPFILKFKRQIEAQKRFEYNNANKHNTQLRSDYESTALGSQTARPSRSGDILTRAGFNVPPPPSSARSSSSSSSHSVRRVDAGGRTGRSTRLAQAAVQTAISHGIPPLEEAQLQAQAREIGSLDDLTQPRTWDLMTLRELNDVRQPRRYFSQRTRRVVYGGNYWSAPMRTPAQRARGMTEDSVTVKAVDRKLLPVPELIKRIEEQQAILARQAEEAKMGPIRAKNRWIRMQRRGVNEPSEGDDDDSTLDNDHIDLMSLLDHETLHLLKQDFISHEKALSLQEFVEVMRRYLPIDSIGEVKLAANLCSFFGAVDVNGDGTMEWNEFTNFITDAGMATSNTNGAVHAGGAGGEASSRNDTVEEYRKSSLVDDFSWSQPVERLFYFDPLDHLVAFQANQTSFNVFRGKKLNHVATVEGHTSELLSVEYIPKFHFVTTAANDRSIRFWDPLDHYRPIRNLVIHSDHTQVCMRWATNQNLLFTATDQKQIKAWRIEKSNTMQIAGGGKDGASQFIHSSSHSNTNKLNHYTTEVVATFQGQNDISLDLLILENMSSLASASLDTTIALFDINTHVRTSVLKNGHKKGCFQLAYHPEYHVLVSAGFEHAAIVWNPYVAQKICKLKGHYNPLIGVQCVPNSPQILTADNGGILKIWDIRNFSCVQTIYVEDEKESRVDSLNSFVSLTPHKRIVSCSHKLFLHDSLTSSSSQAPNITDLEPTIRCLYNTQNGTFLTASGSMIKIWNGSNGILERVYRGILTEGTEISAVCLDDAQKKFITGDTSGSIRVYNYLNGSLMKSVTMPNSREITSIEYIPQLKNILTTAWDGSISLWDENQEEGIQLIKRLKMAAVQPSAGLNPNAPRSISSANVTRITSGCEIITSTYSEGLTLFATGSSSGLIHLWDYRSHVLVGELLGHSSEITAMTFLDPFPLLVSSDNEGNICFWVVRPLVLNIGKCILRLINTVKGKPSQAPAPPPTSTDGTKGALKRTVGAAPGAEICPVTALAFWTNIDARTYLAAHYGDPGITPPPPPFAHVYAGDVNGVIRCWDILPAIKRWNMLPFYTHDRLIPTGREFDPASAAMGAEDPYALTEAEKKRLQQQNQANGGAVGGGGGGSGPSQRAAQDGQEQSSDDNQQPSTPTAAADGTTSVPRTRTSLPVIVSNLVQANLSSFSSRAQAIHRAQEIGNTMGTNSIEYEAALATIPGATARHWAAVQAARRAVAEAEKKEAEKPATTAAPSSTDPAVLNRLQRKKSVAVDGAAVTEEKVNEAPPVENEPHGLTSKSSFDTLPTASGDSNATAGTNPRSILNPRFTALASATGPAFTTPFSRGTAKLTRSAGVTKSLESDKLKKDASKELDGPALATSVDDVGTATLTLPSIPLLPLSLLTAQSFSVGDVTSFMPKSILRHSRANDYVDYRRTHRDLMNELERHARARTTFLQPGDIKLIHWWIAHTDSIRDMHMVREEPHYSKGQLLPFDPRSEALLSCSFDKKVCLWDRKGNTLGHLQQGRTEDILSSYGVTDANPVAATNANTTSTGTVRPPPLKPDWTFQSDVRGRYERGQSTARQVLHRLNTARVPTSSSTHGAPASRSREDRASRRGGRPSSIDLAFAEFDAAYDEVDEEDLDDSRPDTVQTRGGDTFLTELDVLGLGVELGQPKLSAQTRPIESNYSLNAQSHPNSSRSTGASVAHPLTSTTPATTTKPHHSSTNRESGRKGRRS